MVITIFWSVVIMNLINLIDGLAGLAEGVGPQFPIITDIAVEAWGTASNRWQELNECPFNFDAVAKKPRTIARRRAGIYIGYSRIVEE